jgi:4-alpha-glucanotransferase
LVRDGLLDEQDAQSGSATIKTHGDHATGEQANREQVDFAQTSAVRMSLLRRAFERRGGMDALWHQGWDEYRHQQREWLDEHCLYAALKVHHHESAWTQWDQGLRRREEGEMLRWRERLREECEFESFVQYEFDRQWSQLRAFASEFGVRILGDIPIFVSMDSSDVWGNQHLFELDQEGQPTVVAGVPPDYFSELGQRWGNPLYRWNEHQRDGYRWWIQRFKRVLQWCDLVRIDHFRGFEAYYAIAADSPDARIGEWREGPGEDFFRSVSRGFSDTGGPSAAQGLGEFRSGELPVVAEDLGFITDGVRRLRDAFGFPGMRILQFGFGSGGAGSQDLPHRYSVNSVSYTGTHDNDTVVGWFQSQPGQGSVRTAEEIERERTFALRYLDCRPEDIPWAMIRAIWSSVSCLAISPIQDLLGLGSQARMNTPGSVGGNWGWRCGSGMLTERLADRLGELTRTFER